MFNLKQGQFPVMSIEGVRLPFNDADIGKEYEITGLVRIDSIRPQGPVFTFEVHKIGFPDVEGKGKIEGRKAVKLAAQSGITVIINTGE